MTECANSKTPYVCGTKETLDTLSGKWTFLLIYHLFDGKHRFSELENAMSGISSKTLSSRLKQLESEEVLTRTTHDEAPVRVEYSLTDKGRSLKSVIDAMDQWGERYA